MSMAEDCSAEACEERASVMLERDLGPKAAARPQLVDAECVRSAAEQGPGGDACQCSDDDSGSVTLGPREAGCLIYGHGGACLWQGSDMPEQCDSEACQSACEELHDRFAEDDQISYSFMVRYAACVNDRCESVAEIGDRCYASSDLRWSQDQDCSLSDSRIIERARASDGGESAASCDGPAQCSDALGCRMGACLLCNDNAQCTGDEDCVNGRCVLTTSVECHSDEDCESPEQLCLLLGVEALGDAPGRGNAELRAECAEVE